MRPVLFDDFEAYGGALQGWSPVLRKLDGGPFRAALLQVAVGPLRIAHTRVESALEISGTAPQGVLNFGLPLSASGPAVWCGSPASARTVSVYDAKGGFEAITQPGFETLVLSVTPEHLATVGESLGLAPVADALRASQVVTGDQGAMSSLRRSLLRIVGSLTRDASLMEDPALHAALAHDIPAELIQALASGGPRPRSVAPHLRQRVLRRALAHIADLPHEPLAVQDLCRATGASERTLRRAFTEHLGVAPKAFLQARRLNGAYRDLARAHSSEANVNTAAHRWGFWHMGQFAADYRRLFGELPSETLARPRR